MKAVAGLALASSVLFSTLGAGGVALGGNDDVSIVVIAEITNLETGEVMRIPAEQTYGSTGDGEAVGFVVTAPSEPSSQLHQETGSFTDAGSLRATLNLRYETRAGNEEIKITQVWGGWSSPHSGMSVWDREVHYTNGEFIAGQGGHKNPTSNSFSYATGFDWGTFYPDSGYSGPRGFTAAKYAIDGMASFSIDLLVKITKPL